MYRTYSIAFLVLAGVVGCSDSQPPTGQTVENVSQEVSAPSSDGPTQIVIIGTEHFITDMPHGYTPGHLRALLAKIKPDVVLTEEAMNVRGGASTAPYECANVTLPWAADNNVKTIPVGWYFPSYQARVRQMVQQLAANGQGEQLELIERRFQQESAAMSTSCESINGSAYNQLLRDYHTKLHQLAGTDTPWETWNAKVVDNIRNACAEHRGKKVAIVFGAAHSYYFADQLANSTDIKVIPTDNYFPLTLEQVAKHTLPLDYLKAMRPLNLPSVSGVQLANAIKVLDAVKGVPSLAGDYNLFYGKYLMHRGDIPGAMAAFDTVISTSGDAISKFDGKNRLADGARISAAQALSKAGDTGNARQRLFGILNDQASNADVKQYAQQLLASIPQ